MSSRLANTRAMHKDGFKITDSFPVTEGELLAEFDPIPEDEEFLVKCFGGVFDGTVLTVKVRPDRLKEFHLRLTPPKKPHQHHVYDFKRKLSPSGKPPFLKMEFRTIEHKQGYNSKGVADYPCPLCQWNVLHFKEGSECENPLCDYTETTRDELD